MLEELEIMLPKASESESDEESNGESDGSGDDEKGGTKKKKNAQAITKIKKNMGK